MRALLAQLQNDLVPTQVAHGEVCRPRKGDPRATEPATNSLPGMRFELVDASFDGTSRTALRFDQMLDARFWRIGFAFKELDLCDVFAQQVVRSATRRLASELLGLQRILERFNPKTLKRELRIVPQPGDRRCEQLVIDILNEDERHANLAPLVEDFLEKTDLRVKYPGLSRRRGGRVQVTSIVAPELHKTKRETIKLAEEFVFLSPRSLAEFVASQQSPSRASSTSGTQSFPLASLWDCFEVKPGDVPQLASELKRIMFRALTGMPDSPLGPMARVPQPIRQLIRLFVETHAIASTRRLRERERGSSSDLAPRGEGFDDAHDRNERQAEFLRELSIGDRVRGRIRNIVAYGAFIDLGCVDGLLHFSKIPGAVNGMIGEKLIAGEEIEVEVLEIDIGKQRVSLGVPMDDAVGN